MHEAVTRMLAKYEPKSVDDSVRLAEIARHYRSRRVKLLADLVTRLSKSGKGA